jgi:hypothetical protein
MKKATRYLLKNQPNTKLVMVSPISLENTKPNHCFQNSTLMAESDSSRYMIVSGWLVGDYFGEYGTAIVPHYWIKDNHTNAYFDPTPIEAAVKQVYEYVIDFDIFIYGNKTSYIPAPLRLLDNDVLQVRLDASKYENIKKIDMEYLYEVSRKAKQT